MFRANPFTIKEYGEAYTLTEPLGSAKTRVVRSPYYLHGCHIAACRGMEDLCENLDNT